jgi:hypothetical protein
LLAVQSNPGKTFKSLRAALDMKMLEVSSGLRIAPTNSGD